MSWSLGNQTGTTVSATNPRTQNFNIGADGNILVAMVETDDNVGGLDTVATFDGIEMVYVGAQTNTAHSYVQMWYLESPHTGTCQFSVGNPSALDNKLILASFVPSTGAGTFSRSNNGAGTSTNPSINVTGTVANSLMVGICTDGYRIQVTQGANYTSLAQRDAGNWTFCEEYDLDSGVAGTVAVNFVLSTSDTWGIVAASFVTSIPNRQINLKVAQITAAGQNITVDAGEIPPTTINLQVAQITATGPDLAILPWFNYYVDATGGNDGWDGKTTGTPWKTIAQVNSVSFNPGDQILFKRDEHWHEQLWIHHSGTAQGWIRFSDYGSGALPKIDGENTIPASWDGLISINAPYIQVSNLEVCNSQFAGIYAWLGDYITISNVYLHDTQHNGIGGGSVTTNLVVEDCRVEHIGEQGPLYYEAIYSADGEYITFRRNYVSHCHGENLNIHGVNHAIIEDNVSQDGWSVNLYIDSCTDVLVQRNFCYDTGYWGSATGTGNRLGIFMEDEYDAKPSSYITVINNVVKGCRLNYYYAQNFGHVPDHFLVANNTFYHAVSGSYECNVYFVKSVDIGSTGTYFKNNVIEQDDFAAPVGFGGGYTDPFVFSYNCWSKTPVAPAQGVGDITSDPLLIEATDSALYCQPTSSSPFLHSGTVISEVTDDYEQLPRGSPPTIGAFENPAIKVNLDAIQISTQGQPIQISAPETFIQINLNASQITAQGQSLEVQEGPVTVQLDSAQITTQGQLLDVQPGEATIQLDASQINAQGQSVSIDAPAPSININLNVAQITAQSQSLDVQPGIVTLNLGTAQINVNSQNITISAPSPGAVTINLQVAQITVSGQSLDVQPGIVSISLNTAQIYAQGQPLDVQPGAVSISLDAAQVNAQGQGISISAPAPGIQVYLDAAQITAQSQGLIIQAGAVSIGLDTAIINASGQPILLNPVPPSPAPCIPSGGGGFLKVRNIVILLPENKIKKKRLEEEDIMIIK